MLHLLARIKTGGDVQDICKDVQDAIEIKASQSIAAERSVCEVFGLCFSLSTFIPSSELACRETHLSKYIYINSFIIQLSIPHLANVFNCFLSRSILQSTPQFPKHFSSL